jgi:thiamine pyrophosphokinase
MSSHHIIRDQQEPALLIYRLDFFPQKTLGELLEWAPLIIAGPEASDQLIQYGIKIDFLLADARPAPDAAYLEFGQENFQGVLLHLQNQGHEALNVIGTTGQIEYLISEGATTDFPHLGFYDEQARYLLIRDHRYRKWMPAESKIEVQLLHDEGCTINDQPTRSWLQAVDGWVRVQAAPPFVVKEFYM